MLDLDAIEARRARVAADEAGLDFLDDTEAGRILLVENIPAMAQEIRRLRAALHAIWQLHDDEEAASGGEAPAGMCRMRWVAFWELQGGPRPWWDEPWARGIDAADDRRALAD